MKGEFEMLTDVSDANKSYTKLEVSEKSDLDLIAVKVLRKDCPDFLFPLKNDGDRWGDGNPL